MSGGSCPPFQAFLACLRRIPPDFFFEERSLLDVGAGMGHYRKVMNIARVPVRYTAFDYSRTFREYAELLQPGIVYEVGDARSLPYHDASFDIAISGGTIMHIKEYDRVIEELARVARDYVLLHRTPITNSPTRFFIKEAYERIQCLEIWFNEQELVQLFGSLGLQRIYTQEIFWDHNLDMGHRNYLLRQTNPVPHMQV